MERCFSEEKWEFMDSDEVNSSINHSKNSTVFVSLLMKSA